MILLKNLMINENLTDYEKKLIYGNLLENITDIVIMNEETDPISGETDNNKLNKAKEINKAQGHINSATKNRVETDNQFNKGKTSISNKIEAENNERMAKLNQTRVHNAVANLGEADTTMIDRNIDYKRSQIEKNNEINKKKNERLNKDIDRLQAAKKRETVLSTSSNGNSNIESSGTQTNESVQPSNNPFDFLFKGEQGKILDYFINKKSLENYLLQQIAKDMSEKTELQPIINKISFYIKKTGSGLDYDSYIDLKVQNGKFKELFKTVKEERLNKIRS